MTNTVRAPHTAHHRLFTIGCAWSGQPSVYRHDPDRTHSYSHRARVPRSTSLQTAPTHPWAILTADSRHHRAVLAADFDASSGADAAADAAALSAVLIGLGCPHMIVRSSVDDHGNDSGNRHVLALLDEHWTPADSAAITGWLASSFTSFDRTPMSRSRYAAIRFPGSPHRGGGYADIAAIVAPSIVEAAGVLTGRHRAPADLAPQLLSLIAAAATGTRVQQSAAAPLRIVDDHKLINVAITIAAGVISSRSGRLQSPTTVVASTTPATPMSLHNTAALPDSDPSSQLGVSRWAPRRDAATTIEPLSTMTARITIQQPRATGTSASTTSPSAAADRLPEHVHGLLTRRGNLPVGTASQAQHAVLLALAARSYSPDDVVSMYLASDVEAFTHSRRAVVSGRAVPRTTAAAVDHLRRQYAKAQDKLGHRVNTRDADQHRVAIDTVTDAVVAALATADADPRLSFTRSGAAARRTLEAHLLTVLASASTTYHCGARDLARSAGLQSPQTAATHTRTLVALGYLTVSTPSEGRRAHEYQLMSPTTWTQGEPAPQDTHTRDSLGTLLAHRCAHFQHDVWLARRVGQDAALLALHLAHFETARDELPAATGLAPERVTELLARLADVGLLDEDYAPRLTQGSFEVAAERAGSSGAWSRVYRRWEIARARWAWWCAEQDFLTATHANKHAAYVGSALNERGRYPRTTSGHGDHHKATTAIAQTLPPLEVTVR